MLEVDPMKLRIWGTQEECAAMVKLIRANVPEYYIKSISGWYRNDRKGQFSTEGRVYCDFRDIAASDLKQITEGIE